MVQVLGWRMLGVLLLMLLTGLLSGVGTLLLIPLLGLVGLDVDQGELGRLAAWLEQGMALVQVQPSVPSVLVIFLAVTVLTTALTRLQSVLSAALYQHFVLALRQQLYRAVVNAEWLFFARQRASSFTHLLTTELERVGGAAAALLSLLVRAFLGTIYFSLALFLSPPMTLLVSASGLVMGLLLSRQTQLGRDKGRKLSEAYEKLYAVLGEQLPGLKVIKAHGMEREQLRFFGARASQASASYLDTVRNQETVGFWLQLGSYTILASMLYLALAVLELPAATTLLLIVLFGRLSPIVMGLQRGYHAFIALLPAVDEVLAMQCRCEAEAEEASDGGRSALSFRKGLRLERVSFEYAEAEHAAIQEVDLLFPAGRTTALTGVSGSGKSTLADLAAGLLRPSTGRILLDDQPLEASRRRAWRRQLGYVSQDVFLFHESIRANLAFAAPEASEADMLEALHAAAADFVLQLPHGLDTVIGDRGVRLSGGERQRLALARALLRRPIFLVLDEATSALDSENERWVQQAIKRLQGKTTLLIIAHRLSTLRHADTIHVLEAGRLVESGDWHELMQQAGRFRRLYEAQDLATLSA